jgi:hypothetical protein
VPGYDSCDAHGDAAGAADVGACAAEAAALVRVGGGGGVKSGGGVAPHLNSACAMNGRKKRRAPVDCHTQIVREMLRALQVSTASVPHPQMK